MVRVWLVASVKNVVRFVLVVYVKKVVRIGGGCECKERFLCWIGCQC